MSSKAHLPPSRDDLLMEAIKVAVRRILDHVPSGNELLDEHMIAQARALHTRLATVETLTIKVPYRMKRDPEGDALIKEMVDEMAKDFEREAAKLPPP